MLAASKAAAVSCKCSLTVILVFTDLIFAISVGEEACKTNDLAPQVNKQEVKASMSKEHAMNTSRATNFGGVSTRRKMPAGHKQQSAH